jgi:hypothetical protein
VLQASALSAELNRPYAEAADRPPIASATTSARSFAAANVG